MSPGLVWAESPCPHGVYGLKQEFFLELVLCRNSESDATENDRSWRREADLRVVWAGGSGRRRCSETCVRRDKEGQGNKADSACLGTRKKASVACKW